jgi:hypothetical protein
MQKIDWKKVGNAIAEFTVDTAHDFKSVWEFRPNVLIWCTIFFLIALIA